MASPPKQSIKQQQMEAARMHDILMLLEDLFKREEATVKNILDCLYDVGSARLVSQKVQRPYLSTTLKGMLRLSKPAFRFMAIRWFQKNCPQLTADWLSSLVSFSDAEIAAPTEPIALDSGNEFLQELQQKQQADLDRLQQQLKWLVGFSLGAILLAAGLGIWLGYSLHLRELPETSPETSSVIQTN
jgi:hypothetical protein